MPLAASAVPIFSSVWFTEFAAKKSIPKSIEWNDWELLDSTDLVNPKEAILHTIQKAASQSSYIKASNAITISPRLCDEIASTLRPKFDASLSSFELSKIRKTQVSELTREQFTYLNGWKTNRIGLIEGTAGTGKTFLAIETAARAISEGKSILFLCRSETLAQYLRSAIQYGRDSFIGTYNEFQNRKDYENLFEVLIIDEAQDLLSQDTLLTISKFLQNGIEGSFIRIFADYEGQKIYDVPDGRPALKLLCPDTFTFELSQNCRNLPSIGSAALFLSGRDGLEVSYRRADDSSTPELYEYATFEESVKLLSDAYSKLLSLRFMPEEIVFLCEETPEGISHLKRALELARIQIKLFDPTLEYQRHTTWSTIPNFKGFDACCTIVFGLESEIANEIDPLIYVSLSRARDRLVVISKPKFFSKRVKGVTKNG
jgi:DNA replication protein DnaC